MAGGSWTHLIARVCVRPLVNTSVTPNHITTLRTITGLLACAAFAVGDYTWDVWGGIIWVISAFLDRADGELARISGKTSRWGHLYDYYSDVAINALFFLAIGIGLRDGPIGAWSIVLGAASALSIALGSIWSEWLEQREGSGKKAYEGFAGFDFDDVLYLFGPVAWLGWLFPLLIGASIGGPAMAILTWWRLSRLAKTR